MDLSLTEEETGSQHRELVVSVYTVSNRDLRVFKQMCALLETVLRENYSEDRCKLD